MAATNSGTSLIVRAAMRDARNVPTTPLALTYLIRCLTTGTVIRPTTVLAPAQQVDIFVSSSENRVLRNSNAFEDRRLEVTASYGDNDLLVGTFDWQVINTTKGTQL